MKQLSCCINKCVQWAELNWNKNNLCFRLNSSNYVTRESKHTCETNSQGLRSQSPQVRVTQWRKVAITIYDLHRWRKCTLKQQHAWFLRSSVYLCPAAAERTNPDPLASLYKKIIPSEVHQPTVRGNFLKSTISINYTRFLIIAHFE